MSLHILYNVQNQIAKSAFGFAVDYISDDINHLGYPHTVHLHDLLLAHLRTNRFYCPSSARPVARILGIRGSDYGYENFIVSHKPSSFRGFGDSYDRAAYGSYYRNLQLFGSIVSGRSFRIPSPINENFGRHATYSGELIAKQVDIPLYNDDYLFSDFHSSVRNTRGRMYDRVTVNSVSPLDTSVSYTTAFGDAYTYNILDLLDNLAGKTINDFGVFEGVFSQRSISDVRYHLSFERLIISYHMYHHNFSSGEDFDWDSEVVVPFVEPPPHYDVSVGGTYTTWFSTPTIYRYRNMRSTSTFSPLGPNSSEFVGYGYLVSTCIFRSVPSPLISAEQIRMSNVFTDLSSSRFLDSFKKAVDDDWFHITPSSLFSAVDAFKNAEGSLGTNNLQTLVKIPGIVDSLPDIREAINILGKITKRDLSLSTLKEILDLATSTHLKSNFEWRPYLALISTYLPQMISTMGSLGNLSKHLLCYGSYRFKLLNQLGRKEVTLLTRTKIVMDTSPSGLLSAVLGIDAIGVLPKASNLWDLLPFTFVVNWFTGVGEAIRRAEYSLLLATIPAYYIHTYTITSPLSDDELDLLGATNSSVDASSLRLYYRDISLYTPAPRDSKFGFGIPTSLPPLGVMGSLLWQLIFS